MARQPLIYVPNKGAHVLKDAERFGKLVFLTKGMVNRYAVLSLYRDIAEKMKDAQEEDYLLICSLTIINIIAAGILIRKFGKLNLLLFQNGSYIERNLDMDALI